MQSRVLGVGSIVPWAEAGVGAIATQALANVRLGQMVYELREGSRLRSLEGGFLMLDAGRDRRQFLILDAKERQLYLRVQNVLTGRVTMRVRTFCCSGQYCSQ